MDVSAICLISIIVVLNLLLGFGTQIIMKDTFRHVSFISALILSTIIGLCLSALIIF